MIMNGFRLEGAFINIGKSRKSKETLIPDE